MRKGKHAKLPSPDTPFLVSCCVCGAPESDSSGGSASVHGASCGPGSPWGHALAGASWAFPGEEECQTLLYLAFYVPRQKEAENCSFCPLKIMLDLPGYFKIKLSLLYCVLEMHFKYHFREDSCILGIQKRRKYCFQTAEKFFWTMSLLLISVVFQSKDFTSCCLLSNLQGFNFM